MSQGMLTHTNVWYLYERVHDSYKIPTCFMSHRGVISRSPIHTILLKHPDGAVFTHKLVRSTAMFSSLRSLIPTQGNSKVDTFDETSSETHTLNDNDIECQHLSCNLLCSWVASSSAGFHWKKRRFWKLTIKTPNTVDTFDQHFEQHTYFLMTMSTPLVQFAR